MLGAMKALCRPKGARPDPLGGDSDARKRRGRPRGTAHWIGVCLLGPLLAACAPLTVLPDPPGQGKSPALPGPFDRYDTARPPAYKAPPTPRPAPSPPREERRGEREEDDGEFGGILRPVVPGPPWGRGKKGWEDD